MSKWKYNPETEEWENPEKTTDNDSTEWFEAESSGVEKASYSPIEETSEVQTDEEDELATTSTKEWRIFEDISKSGNPQLQKHSVQMLVGDGLAITCDCDHVPDDPTDLCIHMNYAEWRSRYSANQHDRQWDLCREELKQAGWNFQLDMLPEREE